MCTPAKKECNRRYRLNNPETTVQYNQKYYQKNCVACRQKRMKKYNLLKAINEIMAIEIFDNIKENKLIN